jgi:flagellar hook-associated protein 2
MGTITIAGLATGLDTDKIVTQLVALERQRGIGSLETQKTDASARQIALQTFTGKVTAFLTAIDKLKTPDNFLLRQGTSSDESVLTVDAETGAQTGATAIEVDHLARPAIATSANGKSSATAAIATGSGNFSFRVGAAGTVRTVAIDATTTLADLAAAINVAEPDVTASVVNIGTTSTPDFRLRLASDQTGVAKGVIVVADDTTLGVSVTQAALDASFTVDGFTDPLSRDSNTFSDVIPGVTINLLGTGPATVTIGNDADAVTKQVQDAVTAFNDIVTFVDGESIVQQDTGSDDRSVALGPLALDSTVRGVIDSLRRLISDPQEGTSATYSVLAQVGVTTTRDGTLAFNQATFRTELTAHSSDVAALFGGNGTTGGVADRISDYLSAINNSGGIIDVHNSAVGSELRSLEERITAGQRNLDAFEENLRAQFTSLEVLVSSMQSQGSFLLSALGSKQ